MPTFPVGNEPSKIVDIDDPQGIVYNRSTTVQVFFGSSASLCNRADASILDPNATIAVDTEAEVWAVAPSLTGSNTVTVDFQPHGAAYFRGLTAGLGMLVLQSIFSPNFVHLVSGWSINKDGSAEFNNLTIRGTFLGSNFIINSTGAFFYNGTPAAGNLILSISASATTDTFGNTVFQGLTTLFHSGGSVYFAMQCVGGGFEVWASTAGESGPWTETFDISALTSTSIFDQTGGGMTIDSTSTIAIAVSGNPVAIDGPVTAEIVTLRDGSAPATPVSSSAVYSKTGYLHFVSEDGIDYATAHVTAHAANGGAGQTINSLTFATIGGLSVAVAATIYRFRIEVDLTTAAAAGQWQLALSVPGVSSVDYKFFWESGAGATAGAVNQTNMSTIQKGPNPSVIGPYTAVYSGFVRFSAAGTLSVQAATTVAADTFTVWDSSILKLEPLT